MVAMRLINNEKGIALVTSLMLTLISLTMAMALLYMVTQGITTSAAHKRYHSSLAASHGGIEVFTKEILPRILKGEQALALTADFLDINLNIPTYNCLDDKLNKSTGAWTNCGAQATSIDAKSGFDVSFKLRGAPLQPNYTVYSKITDTSAGNSDPTGIDYLDSGAGVSGSGSGVNPKHIPAMYRIEVQGEKETNAKENAKLSVLYAY
jgi:hypothetical protein